jgi:protein involved in polysaccharide export with SLBB domain
MPPLASSGHKPSLGGPGSGVVNTSYLQAARLTGQVAPGNPDEVIIEQAPGMPAGFVMPPAPPLPTEKAMSAHAPHRVAAPDILYIEALRLVPKGPYKLEPMEVLQIEVTGAFKDQIKGLFMISPEGTINLGFTLRPVPVAGMTVDRAQAAILDYLRSVVKGEINVGVTLVQMRGMQNIRGEHLVRPDGTISLGMYGSVFVAGMNLGQVKCVIENHLAAYLINPQISVDVLAYNCRKIYIIADGAGYGQQVIALPATGNETVLDAVSRVQGLPQVSSLKKIWVARPSPAGNPCSQVLPVDWKAITQAGRTETNYQLLPGDRIYIASNPMIALYNYVDMFIAPIERVLGATLLGTSTIQSFRGNRTGNNGLLVVQ